jgi:hypothetical protein
VRDMKRTPKIKRETTTVTREDGLHPYAIHCKACDFYTTAMTAAGMLTYVAAVKLANRHICT